MTDPYIYRLIEQQDIPHVASTLRHNAYDEFMQKAIFGDRNVFHGHVAVDRRDGSLSGIILFRLTDSKAKPRGGIFIDLFSARHGDDEQKILAELLEFVTEMLNRSSRKTAAHYVSCGNPPGRLKIFNALGFCDRGEISTENTGPYYRMEYSRAPMSFDQVNRFCGRLSKASGLGWRVLDKEDRLVSYNSVPCSAQDLILQTNQSVAETEKPGRLLLEFLRVRGSGGFKFCPSKVITIPGSLLEEHHLTERFPEGFSPQLFLAPDLAQ